MFDILIFPTSNSFSLLDFPSFVARYKIACEKQFVFENTNNLKLSHRLTQNYPYLEKPCSRGLNRRPILSFPSTFCSFFLQTRRRPSQVSDIEVQVCTTEES